MDSENPAWLTVSQLKLLHYLTRRLVHPSPCPGRDADFEGFAAEVGAVIQWQVILHLPLVHHLVEHGLLDLGPAILEMFPADGDFIHFAGLEIDGELAQPSAHPARKSEGNLPEQSTEVLPVESRVGSRQFIQNAEIAGPGPFPPRYHFTRTR
jgi:hypothetical protein